MGRRRIRWWIRWRREQCVAVGDRKYPFQRLGKFVFIEYGDLASTAASAGVGGRVQGNNLDDILVGALRAEIEGWGRAPATPSAAPAPESAAPRGR